MLRGFASTRAAPMDSEHGYGGAHVSPGRRSNAQRRLDIGASQLATQSTPAATSFGRAILAFCLLLFVLGVLPATFVFWACIIALVLTCLRLRLQAQHLQQVLEEDELEREGSGRLRLRPALGAGLPVIRMIPGGGLLLLHADPHVALEHTNLQLRQLDEEMGYSEYEAALMRRGLYPPGAGPADGGSFGARPLAVSDADIAALPCYVYKQPRGPSLCGAGSEPSGPAPFTAAHRSAGRLEGGDDSGETSPASLASCQAVPTAGNMGQGASRGQSPGRPRADAVGGSCAGLPAAADLHISGNSGSDSGGSLSLVCPVCLDAATEGSNMMILPCMHQFHSACVTPWLRQQGIYATCPMCKTPAFQ